MELLLGRMFLLQDREEEDLGFRQWICFVAVLFLSLARVAWFWGRAYDQVEEEMAAPRCRDRRAPVLRRRSLHRP